ncbi:MAG: 2Fe-2S iron-sulfur cluster binding domain-containing protein, partial [Anaerolineales bacterium]|nr:2Fe-2S iron-sulfur cluster binding domain-containing protein [Anaerolineales bacterium]
MKTTINGKEFTIDALRPDETAVEVIRHRVGLTGTKLVCGSGVCGACTVLVDGTPMCSCLLPAHQMDGREIQTIEQHGRGNLHPVQKAFMVHEGLQCGFCTPGFINEGIAFSDRWRAAHGTETPSREEIALAMGGHLCRCGAYVGIYEAIQAACAGQFDGDSEAEAQRVDALEKVTGEAQYTVDIHYEGQLEGRILRSPHAHARVRSMDAKEALAMDGVVAFADLLEGESTVRYVGQPIAAIAAVNWGIANAALQKVKIDYEVLPAVIDMDEALKPSSPPVYIDR